MTTNDGQRFEQRSQGDYKQSTGRKKTFIKATLIVHKYIPGYMRGIYKAKKYKFLSMFHTLNVPHCLS